MHGHIAAAPPQQRHRRPRQGAVPDQRPHVVPPPAVLQPHAAGAYPRGQGDPLHRIEPLALGAVLRGLGERDAGGTGDQPARRVRGVGVGGRGAPGRPLADRRQQRPVGLRAHRLTGLDAGRRPGLVGAFQLLDPAVERGQQPVLLVDQALPQRRVHQQVGGGLLAVQRPVLHAARRHLHPEHVVVGGRRRPLGGHRRLEEHGQSPAHPQGEPVLQRARRRRHVLGVAVLVVRPGLRVRRLVQLAQPDAVHHAVPQRARDQRVLRPGDRPEQHRARLQTPEVVPVALLPGVDREQVDRAGHHQPQHLGALQVEAVEPGAVHAGAQRAEGPEDEVALPFVHGRHLSAP